MHPPDRRGRGVRAARTRRSERTQDAGSFDPVRIYLREIGRVPLLTAAQEVTLAQRLEAGVQARERLALAEESGVADVLDPAEVASLRAVVRDGDLGGGEPSVDRGVGHWSRPSM